MLEAVATSGLQPFAGGAVGTQSYTDESPTICPLLRSMITSNRVPEAMAAAEAAEASASRMFARNREEDRAGWNALSCAQCREEEKERGQWKRCSDCKAVSYCSRSCQLADWKAHKAFCRATSQTRKKASGDGAAASSGK